jgi:CRP-like cAMP-binding protein
MKKTQSASSSKSTPENKNDEKYQTLIKQYVSEGNTQAAVKLLFDLIKRNAKARNFTMADKLRDQLQEVDPWALDEIVKSGEIIDAEKVQAIDRNHMRIWSKLYRNFSTEEANQLFFNLKSIVVPEGKLLMMQGKLNPRLFFIDMGQISIFCRRGDKTHFIRHLGQGDVLGINSFLTLTVATASAISRSSAKLYCLEKKIYESIEKNTPALSAKLKNYCLGVQKSAKSLRSSEFERRVHPRYKAKGEVTVTVQNAPLGMSTKEFKTNIADISLTGLSTEAIIPNLKTATYLLGRAVAVRFHLKGPNPGISLDYKGVVVAVMDNLFNNYVMGIKLQQPIDEILLETLKSQGHPV